LSLKKDKNFMKRKALFALVGMIAIVAVLSLALIKVNSVRSGPQASTPTPTYSPNTSQLNPNGGNVLPVMPSVVPLKETDLSPDVDDYYKGTLIIRHPDGSEEAFLIAPDLIDRFISQMPKEDKLVQIISPGSIESAHP